jgi:4-hydroxy-tetrahydrodipicolinate reductase
VSYRVVQWSVGGVGRQALRALIRRPEFELIGLFTHGPDRVGRDAGELCGLDVRTGITATSDPGALLELRPECVVFTSVGETRPKAAMAQLGEILRSGANAVSSSMMNLVHPPAADPRVVAALAEACAEGGSTLLTSGIDPGFSGDALPLAALQICERVDTIRVQELADYGSHPDPSWASPYGFGQPPGAPAPLLDPGVPTLFWGGMVHLLADQFGVALERLDEFCERWYAIETFDVPIGRIEEGTLAAVRFGVAGVVDGEPRLFAEHVTRMRPDVAPQWPRPPEGRRSIHRVDITGRPSLVLDLCLDGEGNAGQGLVATAMRLVNAVPAVVAAPPGLLSAPDLVLRPSAGLLARSSGRLD